MPLLVQTSCLLQNCLSILATAQVSLENTRGPVLNPYGVYTLVRKGVLKRCVVKELRHLQHSLKPSTRNTSENGVCAYDLLAVSQGLLYETRDPMQSIYLDWTRLTNLVSFSSLAKKEAVSNELGPRTCIVQILNPHM